MLIKISNLARKFSTYNFNQFKNLALEDVHQMGNLCHNMYTEHRWDVNQPNISEYILKKKLKDDFKDYLIFKDKLTISGNNLFKQISNQENNQNFTLKNIKNFLKFYEKISYIRENAEIPIFLENFFKIEKIYREILLRDKNIDKTNIFLITKAFLDTLCLLINSENENEILKIIDIHFNIIKEKNHHIYISQILRVIKYSENKEIKKKFKKFLKENSDFSFYSIENKDFLENKDNFINDILRSFNALNSLQDNDFEKKFQTFFIDDFLQILLHPDIQLTLESYSRIHICFTNYTNLNFILKKKNFLDKIGLKMIKNLSIKNAEELFLFFICINPKGRYLNLEANIKMKIVSIIKNQKFFQRFPVDKGYNIAFNSFLNFFLKEKNFYQNQDIVNSNIKNYLDKKPRLNFFTTQQILTTCDSFIQFYYQRSKIETKDSFFFLISYTFNNFMPKDINKFSNMFLNKLAKMYFIFKNTKNYKNKILEDKLVEYYSTIEDLEKCIFAVQFWFFWISLNSEESVSHNSKNLTGFLFQNDINKLIEDYFKKENDKNNLMRLMDNTNQIYQEMIHFPGIQDKKSLYRAKPMRRVYETIFLKIGEKILEDENFLNLLSRNKRGLKIIFNTLFRMTYVYSHYNLKIHKKYNDLLLQIYKKNKTSFNNDLLEIYIKILQSQNFSSDLNDKLLTEILNRYINNIIINYKEDETIKLYFCYEFFLRNVFFYFEDIQFQKICEITYDKLIKEKNDDFYSITQMVKILLKFNYKFKEGEMESLFDKLKNFEKNLYDLYKKPQFKVIKNTFIIFFKLCELEIDNETKKERSRKIIKTLEKLKDKSPHHVNLDSFKSNSHIQLELNLKRFNIDFKTEVDMIFGRADFLIGNVIIEFNGNIHFRKNKIDLGLLLKRKTAALFGYKTYFINDMHFVLCKDKKLFLKKFFKFHKMDILIN